MHQCINSISTSAASVHHQHQCINKCISRISASAGSAHQQDRRISSISASAASAHQQHQHISSMSNISASAHQQHQQHQCISSISGLAESAASTTCSNIVISRRASVTAMIVQLHFDRRCRVFGIFLTRSHSYSRWAHLQHILDLLTTNHSDHGPVKWQCLSSLDYDAEEQF